MKTYSILPVRNEDPWNPAGPIWDEGPTEEELLFSEHVLSTAELAYNLGLSGKITLITEEKNDQLR